MILEHLPGLQADAFLLRMDSPARHFYFCIFPHIIALAPPYSPLMSRIWEGPDWVCFGDAHSIPSVSRSSDPSAEPLVLHLTCPPRNTVDLRSAVGGRTISRYPRTTKGFNKAITLNRFDVRDDKALTQDRAPLRLEAPRSVCEL
jgi:hypothetical protein